MKTPVERFVEWLEENHPTAVPGPARVSRRGASHSGAADAGLPPRRPGRHRQPGPRGRVGVGRDRRAPQGRAGVRGVVNTPRSRPLEAPCRLRTCPPRPPHP